MHANISYQTSIASPAKIPCQKCLSVESNIFLPVLFINNLTIFSFQTMHFLYMLVHLSFRHLITHLTVLHVLNCGYFLHNGMPKRYTLVNTCYHCCDFCKHTLACNTFVCVCTETWLGVQV